MSEPLVRIEGVVKRFGDFVAVRHMDLDIQRGEFLALMGSSGCGKTTTLRMLAGLDQPSAGVIRLDGRVMNGVPASARDTPMVWQSLALFPFLNVRENVEFGLKMRGVDKPARRARAGEWLERLAIAEFAERDVAQLSGGQRQRVALARALVTEPQILLLDEPLSALDANLVVRMQGVLTRLHRELGITFVYVTHSQSEAFAMANRVVIMSTGAIAQIGAPQDIYRAPANRFVAEFVGSNNILTGQRGEGAAVSTALGSFMLEQPAAGGESAQVSFVVSADRVQLSKTEPAAANRVACQLISEEFVGSVVTLFLEAPDGSELKAEIQQRELERISPEPGMVLWASWDAAHAHVLPRSD